MSIRNIVTRGYENGTFSGTITLVVTRGYEPPWGGAEGGLSGSWTGESGASGSWVEESGASGSWTEES